MPQSYSLYSMPAVRAPIEIPRQLRLEGFEEPAETKIDVDTEAYHDGFSRYKVLHDMTVKATGRVFHQSFHEYLERYRFPMYYHRAGRFLIIASKQSVAASFTKELAKHYPEMTSSRIPIDFDRVRPRLTFISGAWFANMKGSHLTSAAVFGPNVHQSRQFQEAEQLGTLSSIFIAYEFREQQLTISLTAGGSVILYDSIPDDRDVLDLIADIKTQLLD